MFKILHSGDWHINLHKKKVPWEWQHRRFNLLFDRLLTLEQGCDAHIIAGDVFDKKPEADEIALFLSYIHRVRRPTFIIPGNHEASSKGESWLKHFTGEWKINNPNVEIICYNAARSLDRVNFQFFPYGEMQQDRLPAPLPDHVLVTHIRGEVPPHIKAEYDFSRLEPWKLVLCGDLHFNHRYGTTRVYYSGSPMNTGFDRDDSRQYGVNFIHGTLDNYEVTFVPLELPRLIRRTIKSGEEMQAGGQDHVVYEVVGSVDELALVENSVMLDKKIAHRAEEGSKLDLTGLSLVEELENYLHYQRLADVQGIVETFKELGIQCG